MPKVSALIHDFAFTVKCNKKTRNLFSRRFFFSVIHLTLSIIFLMRLRKEIHLALSIIEETRTDTNSSCGAPGIHLIVNIMISAHSQKWEDCPIWLNFISFLSLRFCSPKLLCQRKEEFWLGHIFVAILLETANSFVFLSKTVCSVCNNKFPG